MGALTDNRKRCFDFSPSNFSYPSPSKKTRFQSACFKQPVPLPLKQPAIRLLPPAIAPLPRPVHGPQRIIRAFGIDAPSKSSSETLLRNDETVRRMGGFHSLLLGFKKPVVNNLWSAGKVEHRQEDAIHDELGLEDYKKLVVEGSGWVPGEKHDGGRTFSPYPSGLSVVTRVDEAEKKAVIFNPRVEDMSMVGLNLTLVKERVLLTRKRPLYKDLLEDSARKHDANLSSLEFEVKCTERELSDYRVSRSLTVKKPEKGSQELFVPLTDSEEDAVRHALFVGSSFDRLVTHKASNIEITRGVLQCLKSGAWLNDEVINLYLELMKEREKRDPKKFLRCHFFNTFFYKKLTGGKSGYDYKAVRRWTSKTKLGYGLIECDKIFVPIHKEVHWCLAVIDVKNESFQYLDSLGGIDKGVLRVLARYFMDEVKDKSNKQIDTSAWKQECIDGCPLQMNGWDCGMFMLKYADFYCRGLRLSFEQKHMEYFRKRTVKEILSLRAE